jgi:hypothetical protein
MVIIVGCKRPRGHGNYSKPSMNIASELSSGRIKHGAEMSCNLRISEASKHVGVRVILCGCDFRNKSVNGVVRSLK